jgi:hypothetical protein
VDADDGQHELVAGRNGGSGGGGGGGGEADDGLHSYVGELVSSFVRVALVWVYMCPVETGIGDEWSLMDDLCAYGQWPHLQPQTTADESSRSSVKDAQERSLLCCTEVTPCHVQVAGQCRYTRIDGVSTPSRRSTEDRRP